MKKIHQFSALLKFQLVANPGIYTLPAVFIILLVSPHLSGLQDRFEHSLSLQLNQFLWIAIAFFLAPQLLAPELSFVRSRMVTQGLGTEFLLTRAADRPLIQRTRSVLYYVMVLMVPISLLFCSLTNPRLDLKESDTKIYQMVLQQVPGSTQVQGVSGDDVSGHKVTQADQKKLISIPYGNVMIASWRLFLLAIALTCIQIFIFLICQFRFQKILFYGVAIGLMNLPLLLLIFTDKMNFEFDSFSWNEIAFINFTSHQLIYWVIAIAAMILGQLWCERRFSRMEQ